MSALTIPITQAPRAWVLPDRGKVGMAALIVAEYAIFTIFVVAYLFYAGKSLSGPTPGQVLETPVFYTVCLLSSSITVHLAAKFLDRGKRAAFLSLWILTFILGALFLFGTGREWHRLIYEKGLTVSTNLFGTTYYSLVGLHAFHVTAGLFMLLIVLIFGLAGRVNRDQSGRIGVLAMYWHFVDAVWVVVFTVVYVLGR
jgi:cytochrome c oxidase subunit 3/cytochrome o ubiquinol oxidase subunit 3